MTTSDFGAVCDISVLSDRKSAEKAEKFFSGSGLYVPNPTFSWLSRSKLIQVRNQTVRHSLINKMVRSGRIYPAHLPDIYDEFGREIMFETDRNVPLTDLRCLLLGSHLQLPILTFDADLMGRISEEIGISTIKVLKKPAHWSSIKHILEIYRELSLDVGEKFQNQIKNGEEFGKTLREIEKENEKNFETLEVPEKVKDEEKSEGEVLRFQFIVWDIIQSIEKYSDQKIVEPDMIQNMAQKAALLVTEPIKTP